jgi:hypothetical protein
MEVPMPHRLALIGSLILVLPLVAPAKAAAQECSARSGPARAALVELYTSEGCSSCPPADRWLSGLRASGIGGDQLVPLAFHVDYWDYIGWKDEFAKPQYTARQRELAEVNRSRFVYTPQVLLGGADYRGWGSRADLAARLEKIRRQAPGADILLQARKTGDSGLEVAATASLRESKGDAVLYLALKESRLASEVKAGENSGRRLEHDYVVRELIGPVSFSGKGGAGIRQTLGLKPEWKRGDLGIAAFVQDPGTGEVLQAVTLGPCL